MARRTKAELDAFQAFIRQGMTELEDQTRAQRGIQEAGKDRRTLCVEVDARVMKAVEKALAHLPDLTLAAFAGKALRREAERMEKKHGPW